MLVTKNLLSLSLRRTPLCASGHRLDSRWKRVSNNTCIRWLVLVVLAALAFPLYLRIRAVAGIYLPRPDLLLWPLLGAVAIAIAGCGLVLFTRPAASRGGKYVEVALIVVLGLAFRAVFLTALPTLSHDAYRYVWDAHLVAHSVSPYAHQLSDPALTPLRDSVIWPQVNWRNSPTIYPPGAQLFYLAVHAVAPLNVQAMKLAMGGCDLVSGLLTLLLLRRHSLDLRRAIVYWWNPIPVLEFFYTGHVDALATMEVLAALLVASLSWRGSRILAGVLLGLAAMTKIYPLLFALVLLQPSAPEPSPVTDTTARPVSLRSPVLLVRSLRSLRSLLRANRGFLAGLAVTVVVVTLPFLRLGLGYGGFLGTYFAQRFVDEGIVFRLITTVFVFTPAQFALQSVGLAGACLLVAWLRLRQRLGVEAGTLVLSVAWIVVSPHLFPWYVGGLLPLLSLYLTLPSFAAAFPLASWESGASGVWPGALWLFVLAMPFTYIIFAPGGNAGLFPWFSIVPALLAATPVIIHLCRIIFPSRRPWVQPSGRSVGAIGGRPKDVRGLETPLLLPPFTVESASKE